MPASEYRFPTDFRWGTATSSYQVEGNIANTDWNLAAKLGGFIYQDQAAGLACDWWNRAEDDFDLMADMGQNAHRLSIEWSRIEPAPGVWDDSALARYREMLQALRSRGIEPMVTLHHFTNPLWLAEMGGWENEAVVDFFRRYVEKVTAALGDLATLWCTINEPAVMIAQTYTLGRWWPGKVDINAALHATLNVVRAHAAAYHTIHRQVKNALVGFAKHMMVWQPWRPWLPNDRLGAYLLEHFFHHLPIGTVTEGIMRIPGRRSVLLPETANTLDWLGVNYYQRYRVSLNLWRLLTGKVKGLPIQPHVRPGVLAGPGGWGEIHPIGIFETLKKLWRRYRLPMIITENGIPDETDTHRPAFIVGHLRQVWEAMQRRIPIWGYYFWSLVDNYEWTEGYDPRFRFGLIGVDFETQERHIRESGKLYSDICHTGALTRDIVARYTARLLPDLFPAG
ncbi:MAG: glycoside hydrolase family 1 protein [Anaerolineae bacterium]